jgi:hypothetical protein
MRLEDARFMNSQYLRENCTNPARILFLFREEHATDLSSLFHALGLEGKPSPLGYHIRQEVIDIVERLVTIDFLRAENPADLLKTKISVTKQLSRVQTALDMSLTLLASFSRDRSMVVEPLFGLPNKIYQLDVFVLMPFKKDMLPVYEDHIKPICVSLNLSVRRADDFFTAHAVVQDVWAAIASARLIVADCTDRNPNVFYEIGLAHAIGRPTILLTQREEDVPFDLRHLRYISYQLTPRGMKNFETAFKQTVRNSLKLGEQRGEN